MMFASLTNSEDRRAPKLDQPRFVASVAEKQWRRKQSINQEKIGRFGNVPRHAQRCFPNSLSLQANRMDLSLFLQRLQSTVKKERDIWSKDLKFDFGFLPSIFIRAFQFIYLFIYFHLNFIKM